MSNFWQNIGKEGLLSWYTNPRAISSMAKVRQSNLDGFLKESTVVCLASDNIGHQKQYKIPRQIQRPIY